MIIYKVKKVKKVSYFCLILFSTGLSLTTKANSSLLEEYDDHPVVGRSVRVPRQRENIIDSLEKRVRLLFEDYDKREDEVQKDLTSLPIDDHRQRYRDTHNKMVDKYKDKIPGLEKHTISLKAEEGVSSLNTAARNFHLAIRDLKKEQEEINRQAQKFEEEMIKVPVYGLKAIVDNTVKDPEAKNFFQGLLDNAQNQLLDLIK